VETIHSYNQHQDNGGNSPLKKRKNIPTLIAIFTAVILIVAAVASVTVIKM